MVLFLVNGNSLSIYWRVLILSILPFIAFQLLFLLWEAHFNDFFVVKMWHEHSIYIYIFFEKSWNSHKNGALFQSNESDLFFQKSGNDKADIILIGPFKWNILLWYIHGTMHIIYMKSFLHKFIKYATNAMSSISIDIFQ